MDTPPVVPQQATQEEQGDQAAAKAIILTHLPLERSSPRKAQQLKATAPSQGVQEWGAVHHPSLKAPLKEWVLANQDHPQSPSMDCLGLAVVEVGLGVVVK